MRYNPDMVPKTEEGKHLQSVLKSAGKTPHDLGTYALKWNLPSMEDAALALLMGQKRELHPTQWFGISAALGQHYRKVAPKSLAHEQHNSMMYRSLWHRYTNRLTQYQFALSCDLDQTTISRMERGFEIIPFSIKKVAAILGIGWSEERDPFFPESRDTPGHRLISVYPDIPGVANNLGNAGWDKRPLTSEHPKSKLPLRPIPKAQPPLDWVAESVLLGSSQGKSSVTLDEALGFHDDGDYGKTIEEEIEHLESMIPVPESKTEVTLTDPEGRPYVFGVQPPDQTDAPSATVPDHPSTDSPPASPAPPEPAQPAVGPTNGANYGGNSPMGDAVFGLVTATNVIFDQYIEQYLQAEEDQADANTDKVFEALGDFFWRAQRPGPTDSFELQSARDIWKIVSTWLETGSLDYRNVVPILRFLPNSDNFLLAGALGLLYAVLDADAAGRTP